MEALSDKVTGTIMSFRSKPAAYSSNEAREANEIATMYPKITATYREMTYEMQPVLAATPRPVKLSGTIAIDAVVEQPSSGSVELYVVATACVGALFVVLYGLKQKWVHRKYESLPNEF